MWYSSYCVHWKQLNSYPHAMLLSLSLLNCSAENIIQLDTPYKSLASRHKAEVGVVLWCIGANSIINNTWKPAVGGVLGRPLCFYTPNLKSVIRMRPRALPLHMCTSCAIHLWPLKQDTNLQRLSISPEICLCSILTMRFNCSFPHLRLFK